MLFDRDRLRDILQKHRLTRAWRRDDQSALALPNRRNNIDDTGREILPRRIFDFEFQPFIRIKRRQIIEIDFVTGLFRIFEIDRIDLHKRKIPLAIFRASDLTFHRVTGSETKTANLCRRDIDIVGSGEIIRIW